MFYNLDIYQGSVEHFVSFLSKLGTMLIYGEAKKLLVLRNVMNASNVRLSSRRICGNSLKKKSHISILLKWIAFLSLFQFFMES